MIDTNFQTMEINEERGAELALARSILQTAEDVYVEALQKAFPIGAKLRICTGARRYSYFTVTKHYGSSRMLLTNDSTGNEKTMDMKWCTGSDLVTYAYRVVDIQPILDKRGSVSYSMDLPGLPQEEQDMFARAKARRAKKKAA